MGPIRCRLTPEGLFPFNKQAWEEMRNGWGSAQAWVELKTEERLRSDRQNRYWRGVIVPAISACWQKAKGWAVPLALPIVHGMLIEAFFGKIETPLGFTRVSSTMLTTVEMSELIDWAREYARTTYDCNIPTPEEWAEHA